MSPRSPLRARRTAPAGAALLFLTLLTSAAAWADPSTWVSPWVEHPWWPWPADPSGAVPGPCQGQAAGWAATAYDYGYDDSGRLVLVTGNGADWHITWDELGPVGATLTPFYAEPTLRFQVNRDTSGRVVAVEDATPLTDGSWQVTGVHTYTYDADGRMIGSEEWRLGTLAWTSEDLWEGGVHAGRVVRNARDLAAPPTEWRFEWREGQIVGMSRRQASNELSWRFEWQAPGQLVRTEAAENGAGGFHTRYAYDCPTREPAATAESDTAADAVCARLLECCRAWEAALPPETEDERVLCSEIRSTLNQGVYPGTCPIVLDILVEDLAGHGFPVPEACTE